MNVIFLNTVNPQVLPKDKFSLHLILLTRKFTTRGQLCAFGLIPLCFLSSPFSSSSFPPSLIVFLLELCEMELQGCYYKMPISFCSPWHWQEMKYLEDREHRQFDQTVPFSVSFSLWLKGEITFLLQMIWFLSAKKWWPCYLVRAQPAATLQVTHSRWTVTHLTCLSWPNMRQSKSSEPTLGQV